MNQQRSRRFRAAKESEEMKQLKEEKKIEIERNGGRLPPPDPKKEKFDSNCITPGTGFMDRLAKALRFYVSERLIFFRVETFFSFSAYFNKLYFTTSFIFILTFSREVKLGTFSRKVQLENVEIKMKLVVKYNLLKYAENEEMSQPRIFVLDKKNRLLLLRWG